MRTTSPPLATPSTRPTPSRSHRRSSLSLPKARWSLRPPRGICSASASADRQNAAASFQVFVPSGGRQLGGPLFMQKT